MKVILLQNIKGFGQIGDVKNVPDGYGRNFLLPRKLAKVANEGSMKEVDALKAKRTIMVEAEKKNAIEAVEKLKDLTIELSRKASKAGKLFAGIDKADLVSEIEKASGVKLQEEMIGHEEPIKHIGEHLVDLNLSLEIKTQIRVLVKAE